MTAANETYDVFISYSRADGRHAAEIDAFLCAKGLKSFFDRRNLAAGLPWLRALEQAINAAKAVIVLIGPHGLGNTQQYERDLALIRQTRDPTFPVVPVMLPETTTDRPLDFLKVLTRIDFSHVAKVSDAPDVLEQLLAAVRGEPEAAPAAGQEAICPYRGLDAFREEDSAFFFGRGSVDEPESPIGHLVRKVREHPFVMVVGRSGSGKSSLIYAGLLPALRRERERFWNVLSLRPGPTPLRALAAAFNPRADHEGAAEYANKITKEADQLRTGAPELLSHMIRRELDQAEGKPDRLLLYVDQWEELYAQAPPSSDAKGAAQHATDVVRFIDLLLTAARTAPVTVIGTVRADFYDPLIGHPEIRALSPTRQVLLAAMSRSELESTIVEPAKKVGLVFNPPGLVQRILDEAGEDEGMLPLLQYALKESWALRQGNTITADSYARPGGVREAIRNTAERTFAALSAEDQQAARQLFLRLVTPGEGQEDTRARAAMPSEPAQRRIVEQFAGPRTRLLVTGSDRAARPIVEVAHEALIRTWPRLRGWIDANREKLRARAAVLQAKAEWEHQGQREDLLLPAGFALERARALLADPGDITIDDIQEFVALSSAREEAERKERAEALTALQEALSAGGVTAFEWDPRSGLSQRSENAAQILGLGPEQPFTGAQFLARIHPDDRASFKTLIHKVSADSPGYSIAFRFIRPDGREAWLEETSKAEFDAAGRVVRLKGLTRDITARKLAEQRQALLIAELDYRVRNALARVAAVLRHTQKRSGTTDEFVKAVNGRIQSIAAAHTLLSQSRWSGVGLTDLIRHQLAPYATDANTTIRGPDVMLTSAETQAVAMVIHELVTNAVEYGTLSCPGGNVSVSWDRTGADAEATLTIIWRELGGPPIAAPVQAGYGLSLIRDLIPYELGGTVDLEFPSDGACCKIEISLDRRR